MVSIPPIGLGTFGSDKILPEQVGLAVDFAVKNGYRHIDCAAVYGNEDVIGAVLQKLLYEGVVAREELWITSKLWNDKHGEQDVIPAFKKSLFDLRLEYLDLYLVHWPFANYHPPKCDVLSRSPNARPYIHEEFMCVWRKLEQLYDMGLVRAIGTSNMTKPKMELLLRDARIKPAVNELELHPHFQQREFVEYLKTKGIKLIGYCPLGSPGRPERDRTPQDTVDMEDSVIMEIAQKRGIHPASVCLKWQRAIGSVPIPFSVSQRNMLSNLEAVQGDPLTDEEVLRISGIDKNCRLIKGQVFLWKENQSWEDLWDLDGTITQ